MNQATVTQRVTSILDDVSRLTHVLNALANTNVQHYPENCEKLSADAIHWAERITCRLRRLLFAATSVSKEEYLLSAAAILGISVRQTAEMIEITLPCLLPKRRRRPNPEYLLDPLTAVLSQFARSHPLPIMNHCVICFSHIYTCERPEQTVRDYDNLEMKQILDVVASYILTDDSGLLCDAYYSTELGNESCTRISIMESRYFRDWLDAREPALQSIRDLS